MDKTKVHKALVLLIDDNQTNREALMSSINQSGLTCHGASNPASGLNMTEESRYNLLILAHQMTPINGIEAALYFRDSYTSEEMPILLLSEKISASDDKDAKMAGVDQVLIMDGNRNRVIKAAHELLKLKY